MRLHLYWFALAFATPIHAEDLSALPARLPNGPTNQWLKRALKQRAFAALDTRLKALEKLKTVDQIRAYQKRLKRQFIQSLGGMNSGGALKAQVVGKLKGDDCRIEKIIFESRENHPVTASLYLPLSKPPYPAVLIPCGHTIPGKASNQRLCTFFARSGIAAFTYDPIGQGERFQFLDDRGKPKYGSTTEHTLVGISCILVGRSTATYRIYDGLRALDYLQSRADIQSKKMGCTGVSGGGTLTEYLMALDSRIVAAAPACAPTTFRRRLETIGPGDAEQNIHGQIGYGLDHADYSILRAPRPTLLLTGTRDFVDIQGSWDLFRQAKRIYTTIGYPHRMDLIEADAKHGFSLRLREGTVRWMRRWLMDKDDAIAEPKIKAQPFRNLLCTKTGQVHLDPSNKTVMDFNMALVRSAEAKRKKAWKNPKVALTAVRQLCGASRLTELPTVKSRKVGMVQRNGYQIEKLILTDKQTLIPAFRFTPKRAVKRQVLYLHSHGKHADAAPGGAIEKLVQQGCTVLAIDLRGQGEVGTGSAGMWGGSFYEIFLTYLLGDSMLGMRTDDVQIAARYLGGKVDLVAVGLAGPPALHAIALEPQRYGKLTLRDSITSWIPVVKNPTMRGQLVNAVHGALLHYDLTDLIGSLPKGTVAVEKSKPGSSR